MGEIKHWIDLLFHTDLQAFLKNLYDKYQSQSYIILMLIIFCETGLVVLPFLPGDSLLFAAGAVCSSMGVFNLPTLIGLLIVAAFLGDNSNYFIGRYMGPKIFNMKLRFINKEYLHRTHEFYEKHGGATIIIARFMPIIRTFAPFVAGIGTMSYGRFITFSIISSLLWINVCTWAGYALGSIPWVKTHFEMVTLLIIAVSLIPAAIGVLRGMMTKKTQ
jgi:membrane-associated protein